MNTTSITAPVQKLANRIARQHGYGRATRVIIDPQISQPRIVEAHSWHYETRGGTRIEHPSAYAKVGWSNMVYVAAHCEVALPAPTLNS